MKWAIVTHVIGLLVINFLQTCKGLMCRDPSSTAVDTICSYCVGRNCTSATIESFGKNVRGSLNGYIGSGVFTSSTYEEKHIVMNFAQDSEVYLTIEEDPKVALSNVSSSAVVFDFILLSMAKITWIVSYDSSSKSVYKFYVSSGSTLKGAEGCENSVTVEDAHIQLEDAANRKLLLKQIHSAVCIDLFQLKSKQCTLASYLNMTSVDYLHLTVGSILQSDGKCRYSLHAVSGQYNNESVYGESTTPLKLQDTCSNSISNGATKLYVVVIDNKKPSGNVTLRLKGSSSCPITNELVFVLLSNEPLTWIPKMFGCCKLERNITIVVSNNSRVTTAELLETSPTAHLRISTAGYRAHGWSLLQAIADEYRTPIAAYSRFQGQPHEVRILLSNEGQDGQVDPPSGFIGLLHTTLNITSRHGAYIRLPAGFFKKTSVKLSQLQIGNGSCKCNARSGDLWYDDLYFCGMRQTHWDKFAIPVTVRGFKKLLSFSTVGEASKMSVYKDNKTSKPLTALRPVVESDSSFLAVVSLSTSATNGISSQLLSCFLRRRNDSFQLQLIRNSCPMPKTHVGLSFTGLPNKPTAQFSFSFAPLLREGYRGVFQLVCVVSRCFVANGFTPPSPLLPMCPRGGVDRCKPSQTDSVSPKMNETLIIECFNLVSIQLSTGLNATIKPSNESATEPTTYWFIAMVALCFVFGIVLGFVVKRFSTFFDQPCLKHRVLEGRRPAKASSQNGVGNHTHNREEIALMNRQADDLSTDDVPNIHVEDSWRRQLQHVPIGTSGASIVASGTAESKYQKVTQNGNSTSSHRVPNGVSSFGRHRDRSETFRDISELEESQLF